MTPRTPRHRADTEPTMHRADFTPAYAVGDVWDTMGRTL